MCARVIRVCVCVCVDCKRRPALICASDCANRSDNSVPIKPIKCIGLSYPVFVSHPSLMNLVIFVRCCTWMLHSSQVFVFEVSVENTRRSRSFKATEFRFLNLETLIFAGLTNISREARINVMLKPSVVCFLAPPIEKFRNQLKS